MASFSDPGMVSSYAENAACMVPGRRSSCCRASQFSE